MVFPPWSFTSWREAFRENAMILLGGENSASHLETMSVCFQNPGSDIENQSAKQAPAKLSYVIKDPCTERATSLELVGCLQISWLWILTDIH